MRQDSKDAAHRPLDLNSALGTHVHRLLHWASNMLALYLVTAVYMRHYVWCKSKIYHWHTYLLAGSALFVSCEEPCMPSHEIWVGLDVRNIWNHEPFGCKLSLMLCWSTRNVWECHSDHNYKAYSPYNAAVLNTITLCIRPEPPLDLNRWQTIAHCWCSGGERWQDRQALNGAHELWAQYHACGPWLPVDTSSW